MSDLNSRSAVEKQYASSAGLETRISIHEKYSANRQGFGNWIAEQYRFPAGAAVLELGCGNGSMWRGQDALISACSRLVLSDFSEGMLRAARENLRCDDPVEFRIIDIQDIPFEDDTFDAVIANMMLYHVPDIGQGLKEVRRVLKPGGAFYCATFGEHGIMEHLCGLFGIRPGEQVNHTFTLQNGAQQLRRRFSGVQRLDYPDSLAVTDVRDLADYILSLTGMSALRNIPREELTAVLQSHMENGVLRIPKEYGMFICR